MTSTVNFTVVRSSSSVESFLIGMAVVAICTINLGVDEFASTQFVMFVLMAILLIGEAVQRIMAVIFLSIIIIMLVWIAAVGGDHQLQLIGKGIRTGVVIVMLFLVQSRIARPSAINWGFVAHRAVYFSCVFSAILASIQLIDSLTKNSGIADLPIEWFSLEYNTIFTELRQSLAAVGFFVRPTAFFSEPSALAALGMLGLLIAYHVRDPKLKLVSVYVAFVSCSLLGMFFSLLYILYREGAKRKSIAGRVGLLLIVSVLMLGVTFNGGTGSDVIDRRLNSVFSGNDVSAEIRMVAPLSLIARNFSDQNYVGVDNAVAYSLIPEHLTTVFSNWIFNQFIFYGVLGVFFVMLPFYILRKEVWILVFMYMNANGDALYYDRFFYLCLAVAVCCGAYGKRVVKVEPSHNTA